MLCGYTSGSKNWHQKDMCLEEIRSYVQNMLTILELVGSKIGGEREGEGDLHDYLNEHANVFTLNMNKIFI